MKIFIDPGHGGYDSGAVGNRLREKDLVLDISLKQKKLFETLGHEVRLSRSTDVFVNLAKRVYMANIWGADIFISNHVNSGGGKGEEVWCSINGGTGRVYASKVEAQLVMLFESRGIKTKRGRHGDYLYVIRNTRMPAILNEFGFIDNVSDVAKLKNESFRQQLAEAVVKGITGKSITAVPKQSKSSLKGRYGEITASVLNVRESNTTNSKVLKQLKKGDKVKIYKQYNNWYSIYPTGCVYAKYIKLI
ncbi:N-acetylmuramoyl-L-alanine amidase [Clostridium ganghwense]|uniref:N-acetylmuramoyl-L-alanine amidase n=1 Tax=Clostridium ganghwense TaxID=312089 RepID=A0ABT4CTS4_9CLOT|nr:N-acetylmuramoyl-L-alanine amidase [Clostridium ganghwense]MCY6372475.1 N-acetylmuramoyl-L-alanine amidase [Clostridium ganghwense]